jgi:2-polyprenyl-3-methyl-5-hydroxy-6-metoxy-1,4-benzoquinol methylase
MNMFEISMQGSPHVSTIREILREEAPYLEGVIDKQLQEFGIEWLREFEQDLATFFTGDMVKLCMATQGYIKFALDGMLMQKRFDKTKQYEVKTYDQAASEVYQNEQYMQSLYLPGIYLSHFLWRHHFIQHVYFLKEFIPRVKAHGGNTYYDVGVGTGFYLREMLQRVPGLKGVGFDLSPSSLSYSKRMVTAFGLQDRCSFNLQDILKDPPIPAASFLTNVEVLEHLEDPLGFLKGLNTMLEPGGLAMITAAVTAPNADHIFLYNSVDELAFQVKEAGFTVLDSREDKAYEPRKQNESVPRNAVVIVTK